MKIVIGGANGLLGRRLAWHFQQQKHEVVALVRRPKTVLGVREALWDGKTLGDWVSELNGADALLNLAGTNVADHRWTAEFKQLILSSRVDSTRACVEALRGTSVPVFINASAVGFYGSRADEELTEESPKGGGFLSDVVAAWEAEAQKAAVRTVLLRTGVVLAPEKEGGALHKIVPPFRAFMGGPLGDGKQWFPWVHVDDVVRAVDFCLTHDVRGPVNVAAPNPVRMNDFAKSLGRALHRPAWARVPRSALHMAVGEFADELLASQRALPRKLQAAGFQFEHVDVLAALKTLL